MMTSFTNIRYSDIPSEIVPQQTVCHYCVFLWAKRLNANQIHSVMHPVYGDKCFTKRTVQVWCQKMQKFALDTEVQSVVHLWLGQQPASIFAFDNQQLVDR